MFWRMRFLYHLCPSGKFIVSRSKESILKEVKEVVQLPDFKGNLSDLGGPSANMYKMGGKDLPLQTL